MEGGGPKPNPEAEAAGFERDFLEPGSAALHPDRERNDPRVVMAEFDTRPPEYACQFAARAKHVGLVEDSSPRPPWWIALYEIPTVRRLPGSLATALESLEHD